MKEQNKMLLEILTTQRAWAQKNNVVVENPSPVQTPRAVVRPAQTQNNK
jgi:hypothetical protein